MHGILPLHDGVSRVRMLANSHVCVCVCVVHTHTHTHTHTHSISHTHTHTHTHSMHVLTHPTLTLPNTLTLLHTLTLPHTQKQNNTHTHTHTHTHAHTHGENITPAGRRVFSARAHQPYLCIIPLHSRYLNAIVLGRRQRQWLVHSLDGFFTLLSAAPPLSPIASAMRLAMAMLNKSASFGDFTQRPRLQERLLLMSK